MITLFCCHNFIFPHFHVVYRIIAQFLPVKPFIICTKQRLFKRLLFACTSQKLKSSGPEALPILVHQKRVISPLCAQTMFLFMSDERFSLNPYFAYNSDNHKADKQGKRDERWGKYLLILFATLLVLIPRILWYVFSVYHIFAQRNFEFLCCYMTKKYESFLFLVLLFIRRR